MYDNKAKAMLLKLCCTNQLWWTDINAVHERAQKILQGCVVFILFNHAGQIHIASYVILYLDLAFPSLVCRISFNSRYDFPRRLNRLYLLTVLLSKQMYNVKTCFPLIVIKNVRSQWNGSDTTPVASVNNSNGLCITGDIYESGFGLTCLCLSLG